MAGVICLSVVATTTKSSSPPHVQAPPCTRPIVETLDETCIDLQLSLICSTAFLEIIREQENPDSTNVSFPLDERGVENRRCPIPAVVEVLSSGRGPCFEYVSCSQAERFSTVRAMQVQAFHCWPGFLGCKGREHRSQRKILFETGN